MKRSGKKKTNKRSDGASSYIQRCAGAEAVLPQAARTAIASSVKLICPGPDRRDDASVDQKIRAGDEACVLSEKEGACVRNLIGSAAAFRSRSIHHLLISFAGCAEFIIGGRRTPRIPRRAPHFPPGGLLSLSSAAVAAAAGPERARLKSTAKTALRFFCLRAAVMYHFCAKARTTALSVPI